MRNLREKSKWKNLAQSKPVLIILGVIILFFAWSVLGFWNKMEETVKNKKLLEDKLATLEQQKGKLTTDINSLNTPEGKERIFRENYGLAKEGEGEIVIVDDKNQPASQSTGAGGFFSFFKNLFK